MRRDPAAVSDLLDCPACGGLHVTPWCPRKHRRGDLPQTTLTLDEARSLAPATMPAPAPVQLDMLRATQERLPL
jgi:hypothetical protein